MISFDDIKLYLPKYLSPTSEQKLFQELQQFHRNIDDTLFIEKQDDVIYQGDGIEGLCVVNLPETVIKRVPAVVISNTCDVNPINKRYFGSNICYCPIFNLNKYEEAILKDSGKDTSAIRHHIMSIKSQKITQIFFLPKGKYLKEDSFIFFDRICSCDSYSVRRDTLKRTRLFTLSDYGFYLFLFKLSLHFTRIQEGTGRCDYIRARFN